MNDPQKNELIPIAPFNHTKHKQLWDDLASGKIKDKHQWEGFENNPHVYGYCFACKYCVDNQFTIPVHDSYVPGQFVVNCLKCPLEWPEGKCMSGNSRLNLLYDLYLQSDNKTELKKLYGEQIRDLPVKKGIKTI